jgi:predicted phosphate transport protein (TIGR00153 family)
MPLIPKDVKFFDMTAEQVKVISDAVSYLKKMIEKEDYSEENVKKIKELEQQCDTLSHEIIDILNETFITPIDREDIHKIVNEIDDIMDLINVVANRLYIYKIKTVKNTYFPEFLENITDAVNAVKNAILSLKDIKKPRRILEYCIEINRLENSGDSIREKAIMELFEKEKDPIEIIKWKEIYEVLETVLDSCEKVARTIEEVLVKNG